MASSLSRTKLEYFDDTAKLQSKATVISFVKEEDDNKRSSSGGNRHALVLDSTIFHPQGGGQPADTGCITISAANSSDLVFKFAVQDVRSKDGIVYHYGVVEEENGSGGSNFLIGKEVILCVDESRRKLNSRLHSAGHLLDGCMENVGFGHLEPGKCYHFPDGPFVDYKGTVPQNELQSKQNELEAEANALIARGGKVSVAVLPYEEASKICGGCLPDYIPKDSTPRIVKLGNLPGCPCGGTHVSDISEIISIKISQIRTKKGVTKVSYTVGS